MIAKVLSWNVWPMKLGFCIGETNSWCKLIYDGWGSLNYYDFSITESKLKFWTGEALYWGYKE